jgi:cyclase
MARFRLNAITADAVSAFAILASVFLAGPQAAAQERATREVVVRQIASNLYFLFDFEGSNSVFLVTDDGVLLIDTRTHPREGRDLLDRIRKVTDKPIKWVINSHFHGDHHMGNIVFKELGATFVAQEETARIMEHVQPRKWRAASTGS